MSEPVVEEAVLRVVTTGSFQRFHDLHRLLEELDHHVVVDPVPLGQRNGQRQHGQRVVGHPCRSVGLVEPHVGWQVGSVHRTDVVEAEEPAGEEVVAVGILAVEPPGEVEQELLEDPLEEIEVGARRRSGTP